MSFLGQFARKNQPTQARPFTSGEGADFPCSQAFGLKSLLTFFGFSKSQLFSGTNYLSNFFLGGPTKMVQVPKTGADSFFQGH